MSEHREKAVELLAERLYRYAALQQGWSKRWPEATEGTKDSWRQDARLHLEQLDSHLQRMYWERFREAVLGDGDLVEELFMAHQRNDISPILRDALNKARDLMEEESDGK